jgi:hypothetical protein
MRDDPLALTTNAAVARGTEDQMMAALRDITVMLDTAAPSKTHLTLALALAQQHNAYLTGLTALVHLAGRTNPISMVAHAASGLPVMVHLNGLARVRLK